MLAPGGRHVFTVPALPGRRETFAASIVRPDGRSRIARRGSAHPGGDWGYPVFTEFGADLPALLERRASRPNVLFGPVREDDLAQVYVCRKPAIERTRPSSARLRGQSEASNSGAARAMSSSLRR